MKERINELKTKMLHFFQQLMQRIVKWKKRLAENWLIRKPVKGASSDKVRKAGSIFAKVLSGFKIVLTLSLS